MSKDDDVVSFTKTDEKIHERWITGARLALQSETQLYYCIFFTYFFKVSRRRCDDIQ